MAENDTQVWKNENGIVYGQISPPKYTICQKIYTISSPKYTIFPPKYTFCQQIYTLYIIQFLH